jgi:hypothetical protein
MIVYDPNDELSPEQEVVYQTPDHYKLIMVPRYRPFTELCKTLSKADNLKIIEIGGHQKITVDLLLNNNEKVSSSYEGVRPIYSLERLQDPKKRYYTTCEVDVSKLQEFQRALPEGRMDYIHE